MAISVAGKTALITGAGSGINLEFARLLLSKGCSVVIADLALRPESEALIKEYPHPSPSPGQKPSAIFHKANVASWPQLSAVWSAALSAFDNTVDIVVPGAGLFEPQWASFWEPPKSATNPDSVSRDLSDADPGHYAVLDVNLVHPIRLSQIAIAHWTTNKQKGTLVHVGSMAGYLYAIGTPLYFASKHGLHGFVRSLGGLRDEVGIRSGCVAPGAVLTPMWREDPSKAEMISEDSEWITPEEVAQGMYELVVNEELGDGTIFEVNKGETRVVPQFGNTIPTGMASGSPGYYRKQRDLYDSLKTKGLNV